ncbi:putative histone-lysine N-methyltransferase suvh protein, partial [Trifolium medium]|nr:putative histone-lysine N-methyltransferase suvh protein [Trifolium medium]
MKLVRVSNQSVKAQIHLCGVMRRTRTIYDSLRVLASIVKEKRMNEEKKLVAEVAIVAEEKRLREEKRLDEEIEC